MHHHPVFEKFARQQERLDGSFFVNSLGVKTRLDFLSKEFPPKPSGDDYPEVGEEYFEWIDLLESVAESDDDFTMLELGAGFGRWLVNAAIALRQKNASAMPHLIAAEAEPTHFKWMKRHFRDNGLDPDEHVLIQAAVAADDGMARFFVGHSRDWYGQSIALNEGLISRIRRSLRRYDATRPWEDAKIVSVKAVSLNSLLRPLGSVDLIDLDVQGVEYEILEPAAQQLNDKVRRVHIGTHGKEIERRLREMFPSLGWEKVSDYSLQTRSQTPYGEIAFRDGVQTWLNPKFS